eukprot:TRINITY_DN84_c0_g1_i5.p1 TRINITY_DN84_c0_g1~~TRINITY_DN84_c0_g1_i5.p1  ORF type:complete len:565 (-),score=96.14 TRINITY_DN84_c0_g1_i5:58-1752(-)
MCCDTGVRINGACFNSSGTEIIPFTKGKQVLQSKRNTTTNSTFILIYLQSSNCTGAPIPVLCVDTTASNSSATNTSSNLPCSDPGCSENVCYPSKPSLCAFGVEYADGSDIQGIIAQDVLTIANYTSDIFFGLIQKQTVNPFEGPLADGILGLSLNGGWVICSPNCIEPALDSFTTANSIPNVFALTLKATNGIFTIGGDDPTLYLPPLYYSPLTNGNNFYSVNFQGISMNGYNIFSGNVQGVIDSGTSFLLLPNNMYSSFQSYFSTHYCSLPCVCGTYTLLDGYTCTINPTRFAQFPSITLSIQNVYVTIPPTNYLVPVSGSPTDRNFYLGISPYGSSTVILGDTFLRNNYVFFDRINLRIGIATGTSNITTVSNVAPARATTTTTTTATTVTTSNQNTGTVSTSVPSSSSSSGRTTSTTSSSISTDYSPQLTTTSSSSSSSAHTTSTTTTTSSTTTSTTTSETTTTASTSTAHSTSTSTDSTTTTSSSTGLTGQKASTTTISTSTTTGGSSTTQKPDFISTTTKHVIIVTPVNETHLSQGGRLASLNSTLIVLCGIILFILL